MLEFAKIIGTAAALAYLGLVLTAWLAAPRLIYPIPRPTYPADAFPLRIPFAEDQEVVAVHLPSPIVDAPLLLYFHGNAEDLGNLEERLTSFHRRGFSVLAFDYPGYGHSDGAPSEKSLVAASEAVLRHATETLGVPTERICLYGTSLGGGPATTLAAQNSKVGGLVLESTFTSCFRVVTGRRLLPWDVFDNLAKIASVRAPILLLHGMEDQTVPFGHAEQLLAAAPPKTRHLWIPAANHVNFVEIAGEQYEKSFGSFVAEHFGIPEMMTPSLHPSPSP